MSQPPLDESSASGQIPPPPSRGAGNSSAPPQPFGSPGPQPEAMPPMASAPPYLDAVPIIGSAPPNPGGMPIMTSGPSPRHTGSPPPMLGGIPLPSAVPSGPRRPEPPSTFRFQTTLPPAERKAMRHPWEIPWLVFGIAFTVAVTYTVLHLMIARALGHDVLGVPLQLLALVVFAPLAVLFARALIYARLRTSSVRISPTQFPDAYRMVVEAAIVGGLRRVPDAYVVSGGGVLNAFASGHGHRRFVVVHSDLFELGGRARDPEALRFVIGHEVGHLAAGHVSYWRLLATYLFSSVPILSAALSRAQEYTADNIGYRFCPEGAPGTVAALSAGKYLNREVEPHEMADRAVRERGFFVFAVNAGASHPVLTWRSHALRHRDRPGRLFWRPSQGIALPEVLPAGSSPTAGWADPRQALAFLDAHPQEGADVFGSVQVGPVPPPRRWPGLLDARAASHVPQHRP